MKRTLQALLAMSFLAMIMISPVAAATSQGLQWGVAKDDQFTFKMIAVDEGDESFNEGINVTILDAPPALDDPLTNWSNIGYSNLNMTFYNGTTLGLYGIVFLGLVAVGSLFMIPIGNFTLLTELAQSSVWWNTNCSITDNALYWGITISGMSSEMNQTIKAEYLKEDGFASRYILQSTNTTDSKVSSVSFIRDNLPTLTTTTNTTGTGFDIIGFVQDNALYIGLGVVIILLLVIIVKKH